MSPLERIRIEKAAVDCGFERTPVLNDQGVLLLRSAQFADEVLVQWAQPTGYLLRASSAHLFAQQPPSTQLQVHGIEQLYQVLKQAATIARTTPEQLTAQFNATTQHLPKATEAERLVVQRVGQQLFRNALLDYWQGRCCVTGLDVAPLLRASHIKPWAKCASDQERLDVFNGLLLAPHLDALFDGGWISFSDQGDLLISWQLNAKARKQLGIELSWSIPNLTAMHVRYLAHHREHEFRKS